MKCKIILLLGIFVFTTLSCKKITNMNLIDGENTGKLTYKLADDSGTGLAGIKVSIYDTKYNNDPSLPNPHDFITETRTDQDGIAYFSDLIPKNYLVIADAAIINSIQYRTEDYVQIVAEIEKKKTVKVTEFSGFLNISLINNNDLWGPLKNIEIVAYPINNGRPTADKVKAFIKNSKLKGLTDNNGFLSIKVPSNINYYFLLYNPVNDSFIYRDIISSVEKAGKFNITLYAYPF